MEPRDQPESEPPPTAAQPPLEYWHSNEKATPTALLVLALIGGLGVSFFVVLVAGVMCAIPSMGRVNGQAAWAGMVALVWFATAAATMVRAVGKARRRHMMPPALWRMPGRFFVLGFLIGCGVAALLEGICYSVAALSK